MTIVHGPGERDDLQLNRQQQTADCEPEDQDIEVVIYCREETDKVMRLAEMIRNMDYQLKGTDGGNTALLDPGEIYYFEAVDGKVFAYLKSHVWQVPKSLDTLERELTGRNFFRASKSVLLHLMFVEEFASTMGNRIIATMENGEKVIISRHYAKLLRDLMK